jgi:hypothetical protein
MSGSRDVREIPEPLNVQAALDEALDLLAEAEDRAALIGGVALTFYGVERYTKDVDFAVTQRLSARLERDHPDRDPQPLKVGGVSLASRSGARMDFVDRRVEYARLFEEARQAAQRDGPFARRGEREVPVVPLPYLVAMKLAADRPQDEADLARLLSMDDLDYRFARDVVYRHLGHYAARRLDRAARLAQRQDAPPDYENGRS